MAAAINSPPNDPSWWIVFNDPKHIYETHWSFLANEWLQYTCAILTLIHAVRNGPRSMLTWLAVVLHGVNTECLSYFVPDFENFWHAQSSVMLLGRRLPLQIMCLYPVFDYTAGIVSKRLGLSRLGEACAAGLFSVLLDIPYDIMGIKLLWWVWHDTDPNVYDRMYWVPWTSYYFHATFAFSVSLILNTVRPAGDFQWKRLPRELIAVVLAALFGFWLGAVQFIPVYHVMHDVYKIHTEIPVFVLVAIYGTVVWISDRSTRKTSVFPKPPYELLLLIIIHYSFYIVLPWVARPENIVATGLHEPIGNCESTTPVQTISGLVLSKREFLCAADYDEQYFTIEKSALQKSKWPVHWYTIFGTPYPNHAEYIVVVGALSIFSFHTLYRAMTSPATASLQLQKTAQKKGKRE